MNLNSSYKLLLSVAVFGALTACLAPAAAQMPDNNTDIADLMKDSCVYLDISAFTWEQYQPWKPADVNPRSAYACAVSPNQVITTAWAVTDVAFINARRHGQNEFIPAKVKVVDYEANLCLLELDKDALKKPLTPLLFSEEYSKGAELKSYWLSSGGHLTTGRAYLDRAEVRTSTVSYPRFLNYIVSNISRQTDRAEVYCMAEKPVGLGCWTSGAEAGLIPAETINAFLEQARNDTYPGFASLGFETEDLLDPFKRSYLKMPDDLKHGTLVSKVYSLGTGSDILKNGDVILAINGQALNPYGRYEHPDYDRISLDHLITSRRAGDDITFEIWRDGKRQKLQTKALNFPPNDMLVPCYRYGQPPKYLVTGGFVLQQLTREYLRMWGDDFGGKVPPHIYNYYRNMSFEPSDERNDIVVLSYVLPHDINLGYQHLNRLVVSKYNGMEIRSINDLIVAKKLKPDSKFDVIEFEMDSPTVVLPRDQLPTADAMISRLYRIPASTNIN